MVSWVKFGRKWLNEWFHEMRKSKILKPIWCLGWARGPKPPERFQLIFFVRFHETIHLVIFGQILPMKPSIFTKWFQDFPKKKNC